MRCENVLTPLEMTARQALANALRAKNGPNPPATTSDETAIGPKSPGRGRMLAVVMRSDVLPPEGSPHGTKIRIDALLARGKDCAH